jgi:hypothetical protein
MFIKGLLEYGQQVLTKNTDGIDADSWEKPGMLGVWTAKELLSHLTIFELVLRDVLRTFVAQDLETPYLDGQLKAGCEPFGEVQIKLRRRSTVETIQAELVAANEEVKALAAMVDPKIMAQAGTLPWYGSDYALEDYIVYSNYGHKIEHATQFELFRNSLVR